MKIYYIVKKAKKRNTAGAKAPDDVAAVCKGLGYEEFIMPEFPTGKAKLYQKAWLFFVAAHYWRRLMKTVDEGSAVIYQHPMYGSRITNKMLPKIRKKKNVKFIALIHDLESLRGGIAGVINTSKRTADIADNSLLKKFDAVICHNDKMRQYLIDQGFNDKKLVSLEIFDYLSDAQREQPPKGTHPSVAIAGNLAFGKCAYIYNIFENGSNGGLKVNLYGNGYQKDRAHENMVYHGSFKPEELPSHLVGDFGLVWDGSSAETCAGNTGEYLRYNNPHKTSLYLSSGMPVAVWSKAAIAGFVLDNGVGIAVDSLYELEEKIKCISPEQYAEIVKNTQRVGRQLRDGAYTAKAIKKALSVIGDK